MGDMRLLLDTCAFLWLAGQPMKLSAPAVAAINNAQNTLFLSDVSVWEIVLKHAAGKLPLPEPPRVWLPG
jgi:PIN domain nuclease of toxin-antitoxin system